MYPRKITRFNVRMREGEERGYAPAECDSGLTAILSARPATLVILEINSIVLVAFYGRSFKR